MTDRALMQQALEALESCTPGDTTTGHVIWPSYDEMIAQARKSNVEAAITALQERLAQPEQEPVNFKCTVIDDANPNGVPLSQWGKQQKQKPFCYHDGRNIVGKKFADHSDVFPLYTAPQPRQWQGLTEEDLFDIAIVNFGEPDLQLFIEMGKLVQEELKEKNT